MSTPLSMCARRMAFFSAVAVDQQLCAVAAFNAAICIGGCAAPSGNGSHKVLSQRLRAKSWATTVTSLNPYSWQECPRTCYLATSRGTARPEIPNRLHLQKKNRRAQPLLIPHVSVTSPHVIWRFFCAIIYFLKNRTSSVFFLSLHFLTS